ncbi:hypothetical protein E3G70_004261 [Mycobacteroides abscessus]|nr:hypothetical protein [Mycobacteroides abscessus]QOF49903.1 hypothetical protein E3G70_004261 [Mycobacteroides abscessus]
MCWNGCLREATVLTVASVHGIAGYASGCRCSECWDAQRAHERRIGLKQSMRWGIGERHFYYSHT